MTQYDFTPYSIDEIIARSAYVTTHAIEQLTALRESEKYWQAQAEAERSNAVGQRDRAEELRAKAAEYDRIAELIDPTDGSIYDQIVYLLHDDSSDVELRATIAEQARRLEEARAIIDTCASLWNKTKYFNSRYNEMCRAWLAANAPAPQCTCGMGNATSSELHADDCALNAPQEEQEQAG